MAKMTVQNKRRNEIFPGKQGKKNAGKNVRNHFYVLSCGIKQTEKNRSFLLTVTGKSKCSFRYVRLRCV